jgi:hypothetical protein
MYTTELETLDPLYNSPIDVNGGVLVPPFPVVYNHLLCLDHIQGCCPGKECSCASSPSATLHYLVFYVFLCVITYSQQELFDTRETAAHQHYDQDNDLSESDAKFVPPRAIELIPEAD